MNYKISKVWIFTKGLGLGQNAKWQESRNVFP